MAFFALDPDPALMTFDDLLADREAQAEVVSLARGTVMNSVEALEDLAQFRGGDAHASIADAKPDLGVVQLRAHSNGAAGRRGFDRILDQICQHLADPLAV